MEHKTLSFYYLTKWSSLDKAEQWYLDTHYFLDYCEDYEADLQNELSEKTRNEEIANFEDMISQENKYLISLNENQNNSNLQDIFNK